MTPTETRIALHAERWRTAKWNLDKLPLARRVAVRLTEPIAKGRYERVAAATGVPWWVVALIHEREGSQKWMAGLANGQPWNRRTTIVPKGIGPFASWEEAARFAMVNCAPYAARWRKWDAGGALALLESYNGLGYYNKGKPSPYLWAGSQHYAKGKYVADGQYDANHVDQQLGCAILLHAMREKDVSILLEPRVILSGAPIRDPQQPSDSQPGPLLPLPDVPISRPVTTTPQEGFMDMGKFAKAITATVSAVVAWGAVLGVGWMTGLEIPAWLDTIFAIFGAGIGAKLGPYDK
jgi:lysozyme family protein